MFTNRKNMKLVLAVLLAATFTFAAHADSSNSVVRTSGTQQPFVLDVHKSPTCGCCKKWVSHMEKNGFTVNVHNLADLSGLKKEKGIQPRYQSCHTGVSKDGYVFEGHVPAKFVSKFLKEAPADALGLSVPAMPVGTPGMEYGDKFRPYQVLLLKKDGSSEVYARVATQKEQY